MNMCFIQNYWWNLALFMLGVGWQPGTFLDQTTEVMLYSAFANRELMLCSMADLVWCSWSMAMYGGYSSKDCFKD
jgi:hypothetical protein